MSRPGAHPSWAAIWPEADDTVTASGDGSDARAQIGSGTTARAGKEFRTDAEASGYRHSCHELRHFFATVAASEVTLESLSKVLGHERRATTSDIYRHLYEPDARKVTSAVEKVLRADDTA